MIETKIIIFRLVLAAFLGLVIGIEREWNNRPAGLRTHALVCIGSALIMLVSMDGLSHVQIVGGYQHADPTRIAAQVVSGIGFLGAGTIIHNKKSVQGLTTAAALWVSAGIGLAVGCGYYLAACISSILSLMILIALARIEVKPIGGRVRRIEIVSTGKSNIQEGIEEIIQSKHGEIIFMEIKKNTEEDSNVREIILDVLTRKPSDIFYILKSMEQENNIQEIRLISKLGEEKNCGF